MRTCEFPGCDRKHVAKGYCFSHWRQQDRGTKLRPIMSTITDDLKQAAIKDVENGMSYTGAGRKHGLSKDVVRDAVKKVRSEECLILREKVKELRQENNALKAKIKVMSKTSNRRGSEWFEE